MIVAVAAKVLLIVLSVSLAHFAGAGYVIAVRDHAQRKNLKWVVIRTLLSLLLGSLAAFAVR